MKYELTRSRKEKQIQEPSPQLLQTQRQRQIKAEGIGNPIVVRDITVRLSQLPSACLDSNQRGVEISL